MMAIVGAREVRERESESERENTSTFPLPPSLRFLFFLVGGFSFAVHGKRHIREDVEESLA